MEKKNKSYKFILIAFSIGLILMVIGISMIIDKEKKEVLKSEIENEVLIKSTEIDLILNSLVERSNKLAGDKNIIALLESGSNEDISREVLLSEEDEDNEILAIVDEESKILISNDTSIEGVSLASRDYITQTIKNRETVISEIIISKKSGNKNIVIATPIFSGDTYLGAVIYTYNFEKIISIIESIKIDETGYGFLISTNENTPSKVIHHPNEEIISSEYLSFYDVDTNKKLEAMFRSESGMIDYTYRSQDKLLAYKRIRDWILVITSEIN